MDSNTSPRLLTQEEKDIVRVTVIAKHYPSEEQQQELATTLSYMRHLLMSSHEEATPDNHHDSATVKHPSVLLLPGDRHL